MSRISFTSHPFLLGFEQLDELVERSAKTGTDAYPPFNIEQRGADSYRITLAVAGFADDELAITIDNGQLVIRGKRQEDGRERHYLHRGIAARQFKRSFVLADRVEVVDASLQHGLLHIDLMRRQQETAVRKIEIAKRG